MLIAPSISVNDIVSVKLMSGEEIVGRLLEQNHEGITLGKPILVSFQPVSADQMGLSIMPVLGSVERDATLHLLKAALAIKPVKTGKSVTASYLEITTNLVMPSTGNLIR